MSQEVVAVKSNMEREIPEPAPIVLDQKQQERLAKINQIDLKLDKAIEQESTSNIKEVQSLLKQKSFLTKNETKVKKLKVVHSSASQCGKLSEKEIIILNNRHYNLQRNTTSLDTLQSQITNKLVTNSDSLAKRVQKVKSFQKDIENSSRKAKQQLPAHFKT